MPDRNQWNRVVYRFWSPVYDWFINRPFIIKERKRAIEALSLTRGEEVLLVGVGTGPDLPLLGDGIHATGIDLSQAMLTRAESKLPVKGWEIELRQANAEDLPFSDCQFDAAALFLILSVVGNPEKALGEAIRVLRPGGRAVVFDKFLSPGRKASIVRRAINFLITKPFGTDINRTFEPMLEGLPCEIVETQSSLFGGAYRIIRLKRHDIGS
jgi:ubiquinone/menaquinone biosynthesis C-methylase UbiE